MNNILETLVSVPFAVAITALLRKKWPWIDGAAVYVVVLVLAVIGAVLTYYRTAIPVEVWTAASPVLVAILALGGMQAASSVAAKASGTNSLPLDAWIERHEAVTNKLGKSLPPKE